MNYRGLMFFAIVIIFLASIQPAIAGPNSNKKKPYKEDDFVCEPVTATEAKIKDSVFSPQCNGWWLTSITEAPNMPNEKPFYLANYPDACDIASNGNLYCFFNKAQKACEAWTKARADDTVYTGGTRPFCGCGELAQNNDQTYNCSFCTKNQMVNNVNVCSSEKFLNTLKCPANQHTISNILIPTYAYNGFCSIEVDGPYSNLVPIDGNEEYIACGNIHTPYAGGIYFQDQRNKVISLNKANNNKKIKSNLAGFCYAPPKGNVENCIKKDPSNTKCVEPDFLESKSWKDKPQVHHVVPKKDRRGCPCGKNTFKNAAVISAQMNSVFSNMDLTKIKNLCGSMQTEQEVLEAMGQYNLLNEIIYYLNRRPKYDIALLKNLTLRNKASLPKPDRFKMRPKRRK